MSCYEWESGVITLPSKEFPGVLAAVQQKQLALQTAAFDETQRFWIALPARVKKDRGLYERAIGEWIHGHHGWRGEKPIFAGRPENGIEGVDESLSDEVSNLLHRILRELVTSEREVDDWKGGQIVGKRTIQHQAYEDRPPRRVLRKDIAWANSTTLSFGFSEVRITFDRAKRTVEWSVDENNRARERARRHPLSVAFFAALDRVTWTRGSGGQIVGNDEYNRDSMAAGGGGNYVIDEYGPKHPRRPLAGRRGW